MLRVLRRVGCEERGKGRQGEHRRRRLDRGLSPWAESAASTSCVIPAHRGGLWPACSRTQKRTRGPTCTKAKEPAAPSCARRSPFSSVKRPVSTVRISRVARPGWLGHLGEALGRMLLLCLSCGFAAEEDRARGQVGLPNISLKKKKSAEHVIVLCGVFNAKSNM